MANEHTRVATDEEIESVRRRCFDCCPDLDDQCGVCEELRHLTARIESDAKRIAELERVTGPPMPCGCYAVTMRTTWNPERLKRLGTGVYLYCGKHEADHDDTPEYRAWRDSR